MYTARKTISRLKRWLQPVLATLVSVALLFLLFREVDARAIARVVSDSIWSKWIAVALLLSTVSNLVWYVLRWRILLAAFGHRLRFRTLLYLNLVLDPIVTISPMRTGEVARAVYLRNRHGVPLVIGGGTLLVDLGMNFGALVIVALCGWLSLALGSLVYGAVLAALVVVIIVFAWNRSSGRLLGFVSSTADGDVSIRGRIRTFIRMFAAIPSKTMATLVGFSLVLQVSEVLSVAAIFRAFSITIDWKLFVAYVPLVAFLGRLPFSITGLGVREFSMLVVFEGFTIAGASNLVGAGLMYSFVECLFPIIIGITPMIHFIATFPLRNERRMTTNSSIEKQE